MNRVGQKVLGVGHERALLLINKLNFHPKMPHTMGDLMYIDLVALLLPSLIKSNSNL